MTVTNGLVQVTAVATHTALSAWSIISGFLIVIVLFAALFLFARYVGRGGFVALLFSFYSAYAIYTAFPYRSILPSTPPTAALLTNLGMYIVLVVFFYIILRRVVVSDFLYIGIVGLIILSLLGASFLLALCYHVFPVSSVYAFTPSLNMLFAPTAYFFWWFIGPAIGLFFLAR